jgi:RNA polymerase sigma-B factor
MRSTRSTRRTQPQHYAERADTTAALFEQVADADPELRDELYSQIVVTNMRVAVSIARRFAGRGVPGDDLEQTAMVGLINAVHRYDASRGSDFLSFAVPTITGHVRRYFRDSAWLVRPPRWLSELQHNISRRDLGDATPAEVARQLGVSEHQAVEALRHRGSFHGTSLDAPMSIEQERNLARLTGVDGEQERERAEARALIGPLLGRLPIRDRRILRLHYVCGLNQTEIGRLLGVSQASVSRALVRLHNDLRNQVAAVAPLAS